MTKLHTFVNQKSPLAQAVFRPSTVLSSEVHLTSAGGHRTIGQMNVRQSDRTSNLEDKLVMMCFFRV